nr:MAG TPA: hypothetical protein [Caudoviricetes sp.]
MKLQRCFLKAKLRAASCVRTNLLSAIFFVDSGDGSERPFRIDSENSWYSHNLRYFSVCGDEVDESKCLAIIGFKDKANIEKLEMRLRASDCKSLQDYEFNKKAKLIKIDWNHREMYTKDYRFNKKARKLILQLVKEGKLKGKIIIANGDTLDTDWRENEDRVWVGGWWYLLKNGRWQTVGDVRRKDYEFAGFTESEDLKTLAEAYYG